MLLESGNAFLPGGLQPLAELKALAVQWAMCHTACKEGTPGFAPLSDARPHPTASEQLTETDSTSGYILTEVNLRLLRMIWMTVVYTLVQEK